MKVLRIFKGLFQKSLKARFGTQFQHILTKIKKHGIAVLFLYALDVGAIRPKPGHKKLFEKSFLELQKLLTK